MQVEQGRSSKETGTEHMLLARLMVNDKETTASDRPARWKKSKKKWCPLALLSLEKVPPDPCPFRTCPKIS